MGADYSKLTDWLGGQSGDTVTISWAELDALVGGLPASASIHYPLWWHGDRPNTRAWRAAGFELERAEPLRWARFVRRRGADQVSAVSAPTTTRQDGPARQEGFDPHVPTRVWCGLTFHRVAEIEPERGLDGLVRQFMPQDRYEQRASRRLHAHGSGPFCRFKVRALPRAKGVYVLTSDSAVVYVGIAEDLARRWSPMGYGNISPKNCYLGGQSTNCKVNAFILREASVGRKLALYFAELANRRAVERVLIDALRPPWNGRQ